MASNQSKSSATFQSPIPPASSLDSVLPFYCSMVHEFKNGIFDTNKNPSPQALQSVAAMCFKVISPLAFRNRAFDASAFVSFTMYLARLRGDTKLFELAISSYPIALRCFRSYIAMVVLNRSKMSIHIDMLLAISVALQFFEVS